MTTLVIIFAVILGDAEPMDPDRLGGDQRPPTP